MRLLGVILFVAPLLCLHPSAANGQENDDALWKKARRIHDEALVIDAHGHAQLFSAPNPHDLDLGHKTENSQIDFVTMKQGGLDAVFMALPLRGEGDRDNWPLISEILTLRREKARLLGFANYAAFKLEDTMAKSPDTVNGLLSPVWEKS